uniref:acetoacetate decarboxylase family protein n=1 Tax=Burkholderia pseudomallei TaxID=28450 RepID=UPI00287BC399
MRSRPSPICRCSRSIPVEYKGQPGGYTLAMYLNDPPPIAGGRELWGFPKKLAQPTLQT